MLMRFSGKVRRFTSTIYSELDAGASVFTDLWPHHKLEIEQEQNSAHYYY